MGCITEITTIHEVGGRVRFRVPQIKWSLKNTSALKKVLAELPGVYHFNVCVHAGTVVIYYNRRKLSKEALVEAIHHSPFPETEAEKPRTPPPVHIKKKEGGWEKGIFSHQHFLLLDLLKHGLMAGGAGGMGGHLPLAFTALMAWRLLRRKVKRNKKRRLIHGKRASAS